MSDALLRLLRTMRTACADALREARAGASAVPAAKAAQRNLATMADAWPGKEKWACRQGCSFCCHNAVSVSPPETFRLAQHVRALPEAERAPLVARLRERAAEVAGLTLEEQAKRRTPCALLASDGSCGAYAARPLPCRGMNSLDAAACEGVFTGAPKARIPVDSGWFTVTGAHNLALRLATRDVGLAPLRYELHDALVRALDEPDAERRWLAGEDVFAGCRPDPTCVGPESQRELDRFDLPTREA
jgi:hypothetical protein